MRWREERDPTLVLLPRMRQIALTLVVPHELFGPARRLLRDLIQAHDIAFSDTAKSVTRLKGTASDQFLEVDETMDIGFFLRELPQCIAIITTGGKAAETLCKQYDAEVPAVGGHTDILFEGRKISIYRMPSSSRTYPKPIDEKAKMYASIKTILS